MYMNLESDHILMSLGTRPHLNEPGNQTISSCIWTWELEGGRGGGEWWPSLHPSYPIYKLMAKIGGESSSLQSLVELLHQIKMPDSMQCTHDALETNRILVEVCRVGGDLRPMHHAQCYPDGKRRWIGKLTVSCGIVPQGNCRTPCSTYAFMMH